jgi:hypothetical protein
MEDDGAPDRVTFLGRTLPSNFVLGVIVVSPGGRRPYDRDEWRDALVVIEHGAVDLECVLGRRRRFHEGDVLWLAALPLRALHNPGEVPAVLSRVSRASPPGG